MPLCATFKGHRQTIRENSLTLDSKNLSGRIFYFSVLRIIKELCVITFTIPLIISIIIIIIITIIIIVITFMQGIYNYILEKNMFLGYI